MRKILATLTMCSLFVWVGCKDAPVEPIPGGAFRYTSYDTNGVALVAGWFTLSFSDSSNLSGEWHFRPISNSQSIGPQTGDGSLVGGLYDGKVWVELNPQYRDNNLQLTGTFEGNRYIGEWIWISYIGITNHGPFQAIRK